MPPEQCPQCDGTGVYNSGPCDICGGVGVIIDSMDDILSSKGYAGELEEFVTKGVVDLGNKEKQIEIMRLLASGSFELEDITDYPDLNQNLVASDTTQSLLVNDGFVKGGRTYALRTKNTSYISELKRLGHDLDAAVNGQLTMTTATGSARWKRFNALYLTFWADAARTTREVVTARDIEFKDVETFPEGILQAAENVATGLPNERVATETMVYQVDATHNPTHRFKSDIIMISSNQ